MAKSHGGLSYVIVYYNFSAAYRVLIQAFVVFRQTSETALFFSNAYVPFFLALLQKNAKRIIHLFLGLK